MIERTKNDHIFIALVFFYSSFIWTTIDGFVRKP